MWQVDVSEDIHSQERSPDSKSFRGSREGHWHQQSPAMACFADRVLRQNVASHAKEQVTQVSMSLYFLNMLKCLENIYNLHFILVKYFINLFPCKVELKKYIGKVTKGKVIIKTSNTFNFKNNSIL